MENSIFCAVASKSITFTLNSAKIMLENFIRKKMEISNKEGLTKGSSVSSRRNIHQGQYMITQSYQLFSILY